MEIILTHVNADFDALAAMVAAKKLYPEARLFFSGSQNKNVRDFITLHRDLFDFLDIHLLQKKLVKRLIVVDTRIAGRLGELEDLVYQAGVEIFAFDHHPPTAHDIKVNRDFSEITGATTTILVKIIRKKRVKISPIEATLFALGIHEDTGSLTYPTAKTEDAQTLTYLMTQKANLDVIAHFLNYPLNHQQHLLLERLLKAAKIMDINGLKVVMVQAEVSDYVDSASLLTHKLRDLENADVIFTILRAEDKTHIIGRSRVDQVEAGDILSKYGGGGHPQAASAATKEMNIQKIEEELLKEIRLRSASSLTAQEIMTKLRPSVTASTRVKEAEKIMSRSGETQLPVLEAGKVVGFISNRGVDRANHYNLSHAPVKGFMNPKVVTVKPNTPLHQIQQIMVDKDIEKLPVTTNGKILGIVRRSDVLRSIHGGEYVPGRTFQAKLRLQGKRLLWPAPLGVEEKLRFLPAEVWNLLKDLGRIAAENDFGAYLVGGIVRDFLLGVPNSDLDLVIEGDGIAYAQIVAEKLNGKITSHPKFGTAVVTLPHHRVDIASARTEYYPKPAALPEVEFSSIKEDLSRRDFTINAMALALNPTHFGEILDFFGGETDLRKRHIRVLHSQSFVEDPTRIFRAVRFEQRVGFKIEPRTEKWAREAVKEGLIEKLSPGRIRYELQLILSEDKTWHILRRLDDLKILQPLFPKSKVDEELRRSFRRIEVSLSRLDYHLASKPEKWLVYLMALLQNSDEEEINVLAEKLKLRKQDASKLKYAVFDSPQIVKGLVSPKRLNSSDLYFLLKPVPDENLVYIHCQSLSKEAKRKVEFYLTHLKGVRPMIGGNDLLKLGLEPSPAIGTILESLWRAKLEGRLKAREDELKFVQERVKILKEKTQGQGED